MHFRPHPTHARSTRRLALALLLATLLSFAVAFFLSDGTGSSPRDLALVSAALVLGTLCLAAFILRGYLCRCATCGRWLAKQEKVDTDLSTRRFVCEHCQIVWDSQVRLGT